MGRQQSLKLPSHLYLSPTTPSPAPSYFPTSFISAKAYPSATLFQETSTSARNVSDRIPGFKTSAAFLTTLRANLNLDFDSTPTSLTNTPDSLRPINMASSTGSLPPPSPSPLGQLSESEHQTVDKAEDPLEGVPDLTTTVVTSEDDKVEALHLIADTVAQQRSTASQAILFHPAVLSTMAIILGLIYQWMYKGSRSDWALIGTTSGGAIMALLVGIRGITGGYIEEAEAVGTWKWLDKDRATTDAVGDQDTVLLTRFGDLAIGALILRGVRDTNRTTSNNGGRKRQNSSGKNTPVTGKIRAVSVRHRYRRNGIGTELFEEAVTVCQDNGWQGPEFAEEHAHSKSKIPEMFKGRFVKRDRKIRAVLEKVKEDAGVGNKSGRKGKK